MHVPAGAEQSLRTIWEALRIGSKAFKLAARRFNTAQLRGFVEDNFLDDMIAAEALLIEPHSRQKSKTLALNAAYYLGGASQPERRLVFELFRNAYRVRSATVHGEEPKAADMEMNGVPMSFIQFKDAVEDRLRSVFQKMVNQNQTAAAIDWRPITLGTEP